MSETLLLAASLLSGEAVAVPPQAKPDVDPWLLVDQMGVLDQKRVQTYQRRSQPLQGATVSKPEVSQVVQSRLAAQTTGLKSAEPKVIQANYESINYEKAAYQQQAVSVLPSSTVTSLDQTSLKTSTIETSPQPQNYQGSANTSVAPGSNPQLFSQRLSALKTGQLYTRLNGNSFHTAWSGA
ncbi:MAG: hypothetical protein WBB82_12995, partial [Limnothrix sp.]